MVDPMLTATKPSPPGTRPVPVLEEGRIPFGGRTWDGLLQLPSFLRNMYARKNMSPACQVPDPPAPSALVVPLIVVGTVSVGRTIGGRCPVGATRSIVNMTP